MQSSLTTSEVCFITGGTETRIFEQDEVVRVLAAAEVLKLLINFELLITGTLYYENYIMIVF